MVSRTFNDLTLALQITSLVEGYITKFATTSKVPHGTFTIHSQCFAIFTFAFGVAYYRLSHVTKFMFPPLEYRYDLHAEAVTATEMYWVALLVQASG